MIDIKNLKRVWQCGYCGVVYGECDEADDCHEGEAELSFKDTETGLLYASRVIKDKLCHECKGYGFVSGGLDIDGEATSIKCFVCKGSGIDNE